MSSGEKMESRWSHYIMKYKYWILVIVLLPLIFAGYSYFNEKNAPKTYAASTQLDIGSFDNTLTTTNYSKYMLTTQFLQNLIQEENLNISDEALKSELVVTPNDENLLTVKLTGKNEQEVNKQIHAVVDYFLKLRNQEYDNKVKLVKESIDRLDQQEPSSLSAYDTEKLRYDLKEKLLNWHKAQTVEPIVVNLQGQSPLVKAVMSYILGFGLLFVLAMILLLGKNTKRKETNE